MIEVTAWHGRLEGDSAKAMDAIAKPSLVRPNHSWMFEGTIGEFAERWQRNFMVLYSEGKPFIFVTHHYSFSQR
jgi:hypothetical protein